MRIGHGYDVHRLVVGRELIIGGVTIPHEVGLDGHSDADVLVHAVMDAILGALGLGDIGQHFPDTDAQYYGACSVMLLGQVIEIACEAGYVLGNLDVTVVAERPRFAPYVPEMRRILADALRVEMDQVSIKATTEEGLGFTGAGEGVAAHAVVLMREKCENA